MNSKLQSYKKAGGKEEKNASIPWFRSEAAKSKHVRWPRGVCGKRVKLKLAWKPPALGEGVDPTRAVRGSLQRAGGGTAGKAQEAEETQEVHLVDGTERSQTGSPGLSQDHQTLSHLLVLPSLSHLLPPGVNMPFH